MRELNFKGFKSIGGNNILSVMLMVGVMYSLVAPIMKTFNITKGVMTFL